MILAACVLNGYNLPMASVMHRALRIDLQPKRGVYVRFPGANTNNVSADQLISALSCWVIMRRPWHILAMLWRMMMRLGFAQNIRDGLGGSERKKLPDFMLIRALPLFCRTHWLLYPIAILSDFLLVLAAFAAVGPVWRDDKGFTRRGPDDVDDNVTILTLAACRKTMPTPLSKLACFIYAKLRPWNYGTKAPGGEVVGALSWYHRAESGGNPEIALMWQPVISKLFNNL
jgi:hypothetical protein